MKANQVERALQNLDAAACDAAIGGTGLTDHEDARFFLEKIRQTGCMLVEWANPERERRRDAVATKCRDLLAAFGDAELLNEFNQHVDAAVMIERGFRAVEFTLAKHPVSARTPAEQVWGLLKWVEGGMKHLDEQIAAAMADSTSTHDITQLQIPTEGGGSVRPDAVVTGAVSNAGNTLLMLGHRHGFLDPQSGVFLLPSEPPLDQKAVEDGGALILLSSGWTQLRRGWERVRFLDGTVCCGEQDVRVEGGGTRRMEVLEFSPPSRVELLDQIASDRLSQRLLTNQIQFQTETDIASQIRLPDGEALPLPPDAWISLEEFNASHSLSQHYYLPLNDERQLAQGLSLKAWLRGYAIYARCLARDLRDQPALQIIRYTEAELLARLTLGGLGPAQAALFIELTTFSRGSKDLFDTPLVRAGDGHFHFFAPAYLSPNPGAVLVSRLGRLGVRFEDKGKRFELHTRKLFDDAGIPARSFKYTLEGKQWDCDVAVLWNDTLFVFECKNYGLPDGHLPSLYHFVVQLNGHIAQAKRIARQFQANPAVVRQYFGEKASWKQVVPVVLNALPWSAGKLDDVYCYDASALGRFFEEGSISIKMMMSVAPNITLMRRHIYKLWQAGQPTPADLLHEMDEPAQLRMPVAERQLAGRLMPLSGEMAVGVPEWTPRTLTMEEKFRACGETEESAKALALQFEEQIPSMVRKARERLAARQTSGQSETAPPANGHTQ